MDAMSDGAGQRRRRDHSAAGNELAVKRARLDGDGVDDGALGGGGAAGSAAEANRANQLPIEQQRRVQQQGVRCLGVVAQAGVQVC